MTGQFLCFAAIAAALVGCTGGASSDDFGPDPDFSSLDARLSTPSGTMTSSAVMNAVGAVDALNTPSVGIVALSHVTPSKTSCDALAHGDASGTCPCAGGGALTYDFSEIVDARANGNANAPITLRMRLDACHVDGAVVNGVQFARVAGQTASIDATVDVSDGATAAPANIDVWHTDGTWWVRSTVADGAIVVGVADQEAGDPSSDRHVVVKDKTGQFTCDVDHGVAHCTGPYGATHSDGATRSLET